MNTDLAKDRLVTHAITNYLTAAFQGKFAELNVLAQLGHPSFQETEVARTQKSLSKVFTWTNQLFEDECLFSATWTAAETFESQDALAMLDQLKPDLYQSAASAARILSLTSLPQNDDLSAIAALYARHAYSRDTYIRGFLDYAERFSIGEMARRYQAFIPECEYEIGRCQELLGLLAKIKGDRSLLPSEFFPLLFQATIALPAFFRSHIHDINQLSSQFRGGLSWSAAEFSQAEADLWTSAGLGPSAAGYFRAFSMGPEEAGKWRDVGVFEATMAIEWKKGGFSPHSAKVWIEAKLPPPLAFVWSMNKFTPEEAAEHVAKGILQPPPRESVPRKKERKETPAAQMPKKMSFPKKL